MRSKALKKGPNWRSPFLRSQEPIRSLSQTGRFISPGNLPLNLKMEFQIQISVARTLNSITKIQM